MNDWQSTSRGWPGSDLGRWMDEHGPALVLFARQFCDCPEDVVQEALLKLATHRRSVRKPVTWLYRVVRNAAISAARRNSRRRLYEQRAAEQHAAWFVTDNGHHEQIRAAEAALAGLPDDQREIVIVHVWGGLSFEQVAELVGCSTSTAHRRYQQALLTLRERMEP